MKGYTFRTIRGCISLTSAHERVLYLCTIEIKKKCRTAKTCLYNHQDHVRTNQRRFKHCRQVEVVVKEADKCQG